MAGKKAHGSWLVNKNNDNIDWDNIDYFDALGLATLIIVLARLNSLGSWLTIIGSAGLVWQQE
jgi:anti-anti-sigma regulatory factor